MNSPLARARRRTRRSAMIAVVLTVACATWACWPPPTNAASPTHTRATATPPRNPGAPPPAPLDLAAFDAALWIDPPTPVVAAAPTPPPPPPPLRGQLIAIVGTVDSEASPGQASQSVAPRTNMTLAAESAPDAPPLRSAAASPQLAAIFYDPDADALRTLRTGEPIDGRTIDAIDPRGVTLSLANATQRLDLRPDARPPLSGRLGLSAAEELALLMGKPLAPRHASTPTNDATTVSSPRVPERPPENKPPSTPTRPTTAPRGKGKRP